MSSQMRLFWVLLFMANVASAGEQLSALFQSEYSVGFGERLHISGEAAAGFFDTESEGQFPNNEFRLDEAKVFVDAKVIDDIYVFLEVDLILREEGDEEPDLGEFYIDFEDVSKLWNQEGVLNIRFGRFDIPFGEEYLTRDAIDNPLITHSLIDIWGVDEGIEFYGSVKNVEYILAIQNGGEPIANDFNSDKAISGRVRIRPRSNMLFSFSGMRTGDLDVEGDRFSEVWYGNGFFRLLGSPLSATNFEANLIQADGHLSWEWGHMHAALGRLHYDDNDILADNQRSAHYFQIEAKQIVYGTKERPVYAAMRFSKLDSDEGLPMVGNGDLGEFLFDDARFTKELWRLSLGGGYQIGRHFLIKIEYNFENGNQLDGTDRDSENFFGIQAAARF